MLRSASVTNSSISLPTVRVTPRTMALAASSGVGPLAAKASGLRNAAIRPSCWSIGRVCGSPTTVEVRVEAIDRLGQHRVAEAIDGVRELGDDRRIEVDVVHLGRREERVDQRLDGARELLEHQMLVLHLGAELGGLEQALAVPHQRVDLRLRRRKRGDRRQQPFVEEGEIVAMREDRVLGLIDQAVVLGVEDAVDRGQADVLVHAAVAGDVVRVEQLVVVGKLCPGVGG